MVQVTGPLLQNSKPEINTLKPCNLKLVTDTHVTCNL